MLKSMTWRSSFQTKTLRKSPYIIGPYFKIPTLDTHRGSLGDNRHIPYVLLHPPASSCSGDKLESELSTYSFTG